MTVEVAVAVCKYAHGVESTGLHSTGYIGFSGKSLSLNTNGPKKAQISRLWGTLNHLRLRLSYVVSLSGGLLLL